VARSRLLVGVVVVLAAWAGASTPVSARPAAATTTTSTSAPASSSARGTGATTATATAAAAAAKAASTKPSARAVAKLPADLRDSPSRLELIPTFKAEAARYHVPADMLMAMAYTESRWRADAVSSSGAVGVCQLLPATSRWLAREMIGLPKLNPKVAADNIRMGARLLRQLLDSFKTERLALASYFEGHGSIARHGPTRAGKRYAIVVQSRRAMFNGL
jgi:N-acetylmuramoyl-L-alanine amidase